MLFFPRIHLLGFQRFPISIPSNISKFYCYVQWDRLSQMCLYLNQNWNILPQAAEMNYLVCHWYIKDSDCISLSYFVMFFFFLFVPFLPFFLLSFLSFLSSLIELLVAFGLSLHKLEEGIQKGMHALFVSSNLLRNSSFYFIAYIFPFFEPAPYRLSSLLIGMLSLPADLLMLNPICFSLNFSFFIF